MSNTYAMNYNATNRSASLLRILSIALTVALIIIASGFGGRAAAQPSSSRKTLNRLTQQGGNDAASTLFRGGRDLITDQQWAKAEEKFSQYVSGYPNEKNVDAALYWMAYSEYQLTRFDQCKNTLNRLLNNYQNTTWKEDARTLLAQIPGGFPVPPVTPAAPQPRQPSGDYALAGNPVVKIRPITPKPAAAPFDEGDNGDQPSDDDPCEFKIVVLQALFQSDVQRGITAASDWLAPGSTQTLRCKGAALTLL